MTEQELLEQIDYVKSAIKIAKKKIAAAKKAVDDGESELIELRIQQEKLVSELDEFRKTTPVVEPELWEIEIDRFRNAYPELCEWARKRDEGKTK